MIAWSGAIAWQKTGLQGSAPYGMAHWRGLEGLGGTIAAMKPKFGNLILILSLGIGALAGACGAPAVPASPSPQPAATLAEATALPTATPAPTATAQPSPTPAPTATATVAPTPTAPAFKGFLDNFRFYRAWFDGETTVYYFLNAAQEYPLYAAAGGMNFVCEPDPELTRSMVCRTEDGRLDYLEKQEFTFYTEAGHHNLIHEMAVQPPPGISTRYSNTFDCPLRGQNVQCENEYRQYASGYCSTSITCYDACGYWYSQDNLPAEPDAPWTPIGSCP